MLLNINNRFWVWFKLIIRNRFFKAAAFSFHRSSMRYIPLLLYFWNRYISVHSSILKSRCKPQNNLERHHSASVTHTHEWKHTTCLFIKEAMDTNRLNQSHVLHGEPPCPLLFNIEGWTSERMDWRETHVWRCITTCRWTAVISQGQGFHIFQLEIQIMSKQRCPGSKDLFKHALVQHKYTLHINVFC